ncbi:Pro-Pol polyprotein [Merluccius polli]|uniref:Gypsy retrotransposon integrase-like protein 1 n=1 Tax=Merluccius polli TaxID=89951 RepID=A0AA47MPT3_MERPO|nr:Pro-Pol polyprotein [Merluccius polli]
MLHTQCHSTVASRAVVSAVLEQSLDQDMLPPQAFLLPQLVQSVQPPELSEVCPLTGNKLIDAQRADPCLSRVLLFVERQRRPSRRERSHEPVEALRLLRHWDKLTVKTEKDRYVVPSVLREKVLKGVHDEAGHQGQRRTLYLTRQRFFWQGMERDVRDHVKCCRRCVCSKSPEPEARAQLESVITSRPLELVCIDFWSAEDSSNKWLDVLVLTDHFTRLAQAYLCPNQSAKVVAQQLWNNFCVYGFPERIHSDQGANFESSLIAEMLKVAGVQKSHTTPYHPMANGGVERFNRTLHFPPKAKHRWPQLLTSLTFSYNATVHETTGFAPFQLMFGRTPRLPVDVMFGSVIMDDQVVDYDDYVQSLRRDLAEAVRVAQVSTTKQQEKQTDYYNKRFKGAVVEAKEEKGNWLIAGKTAFTLLWRNKDNTHTFWIKSSATDRVKVVHRNLIMPVNFLPSLRMMILDVDVAGSVALPDCGPEDRTVSWISRLPASAGDRKSDSLDVPLTVDIPDMTVDVPVGTGCPADQSDSQPVTSEHGLGTQLDTGCVVLSGAGQTKPNVTCSDRAVSIDTRYGRVVRPVMRLIQQMQQKVFVGHVLCPGFLIGLMMI